MSQQQYISSTFSEYCIGYCGFGFQGQEAESEITNTIGSHSFFKYRVSDNRIGRFWSVDPLAAKYPHNSSYAFSENRVIDGIELEGLEVVLFNKSDETFYSSAVKDKKSNKYWIDVYAHGATSGMVDNSKDKLDGEWIESAKQLDKKLIEKEGKWRECKKNNTPVIIVLHSCHVGETPYDFEGNGEIQKSFAQKVSESPEFKNAIIIAPDNINWVHPRLGEIGPASQTGESGKWQVFYRGKNLGYLSKKDIPNLSGVNEIPMDKLKKQVEQNNRLQKK